MGGGTASSGGLQGRITWPLAVTAAVAAYGSSFTHGWNTGVLNAPENLIKAFLNESYTAHFGGPVDTELLNFLWSFTVSLYVVGGCAGAFSTGWLADKLGRKKALLVLHVCGFLGGALFCACEAANSFEMLALARLIVGYGCGAGSGIVPMYLTEIAPVNYRGSMGVLHQLALTIGILVAQIMGMRQILGNEHWPYLLLLTAFPCLVSLIVLPFFPESPRYLLINQNNEQAATQALRRYRGKPDVSLDVAELKREHEEQAGEQTWTFKQLLLSKDLRLPLLLVCAVNCAQQLSGINVVFYYSKPVFDEAGIPEDYTQYAVVSTGIVNVIMTLVSVWLVDKSGRRPLFLVGMILMVIAMTCLTISLNLVFLTWMGYISTIFMFLDICGFAIGLGSIPQFLGGELFRQGPKPPAMSMACLLNWLCNLLVAISFPAMQAAIGPFSFIPYIIMLSVFVAIIWKFLPETKNKTHEEIYRMFAKDKPHEDDPHDAETAFSGGKDANANETG